MLRRWTEAPALFAGPAGLLAGDGMGAESLGEAACGGFDEVAERVADAAAALAGSAALRAAGRRLRMVVDDRWVRLFSLDWPASLGNYPAFVAWRAASFERRFDLPSADWTIVSPGAWPGRRGLCAAIPGAALKSLGEALSRAGIRLTSLMPLALAELQAARLPTMRGAALFAGGPRAGRPVFLLAGARPVDCLMLPARVAPAGFAQPVFAERGSLEKMPATLLASELSLPDTLRALLAGERLPVARSALASMPPPVTREASGASA